MLFTGSLRFQSMWLSFQDGLGFSMHCVSKWNEAIGLESFGVALQLLVNGEVGSQPGFVGVDPAG